VSSKIGEWSPVAEYVTVDPKLRCLSLEDDVAIRVSNNLIALSLQVVLVCRHRRRALSFGIRQARGVYEREILIIFTPICLP